MAWEFTEPNKQEFKTEANGADANKGLLVSFQKWTYQGKTSQPKCAMRDKDQEVIIAQQWRPNWDNEISTVFLLLFSAIIPSQPLLDSPQHLTSAIAHIIHDPQRDSLGFEATWGQSYFKKHILVSDQKHQNLMSQKKNPSAVGEAGRHVFIYIYI